MASVQQAPGGGEPPRQPYKKPLPASATGITPKKGKKKNQSKSFVSCYADLPEDEKNRPKGADFREAAPPYLDATQLKEYGRAYDSLNDGKTRSDITDEGASDQRSRARRSLWQLWYRSFEQWRLSGEPTPIPGEIDDKETPTANKARSQPKRRKPRKDDSDDNGEGDESDNVGPVQSMARTPRRRASPRKQPVEATEEDDNGLEEIQPPVITSRGRPGRASIFQAVNQPPSIAPATASQPRSQAKRRAPGKVESNDKGEGEDEDSDDAGPVQSTARTPRRRASPRRQPVEATQEDDEDLEVIQRPATSTRRRHRGDSISQAIHQPPSAAPATTNRAGPPQTAPAAVAPYIYQDNRLTPEGLDALRRAQDQRFPEVHELVEDLEVYNFEHSDPMRQGRTRRGTVTIYPGDTISVVPLGPRGPPATAPHPALIYETPIAARIAARWAALNPTTPYAANTPAQNVAEHGARGSSDAGGEADAEGEMDPEVMDEDEDEK